MGVHPYKFFGDFLSRSISFGRGRNLSDHFPLYVQTIFQAYKNHDFPFYLIPHTPTFKKYYRQKRSDTSFRFFCCFLLRNFLFILKNPVTRENEIGSTRIIDCMQHKRGVGSSPLLLLLSPLRLINPFLMGI